MTVMLNIAGFPQEPRVLYQCLWIDNAAMCVVSNGGSRLDRFFCWWCLFWINIWDLTLIIQGKWIIKRTGAKCIQFIDGAMSGDGQRWTFLADTWRGTLRRAGPGRLSGKSELYYACAVGCLAWGQVVLFAVLAIRFSHPFPICSGMPKGWTHKTWGLGVHILGCQSVSYQRCRDKFIMSTPHWFALELSQSWYVEKRRMSGYSHTGPETNI